MILHRFWSRLFPRPSIRTFRHVYKARLRLEPLEDRTLLSASLLFDATAGGLVIHGDGRDNSVRETLSAVGYLEVTLDGKTHSSDPTSAFFDQALAGAIAGTLAGIRFDGGGGHDALILGNQRL